MKSLSDLVIIELAHVYDVEHRLSIELPHLCDLTSTATFHEALLTMLNMTRSHLVQVEALFEAFGTEMVLLSCEPAKLLLLEVEEIAAQHQRSPLMNDCMLALMQKLVGYKLNSYNSLYAWAGRLDKEEAVDVLAGILADENSMEQHLQLLSFDLMPEGMHHLALFEGRPDKPIDMGGGSASSSRRTDILEKFGEHPPY